MPRHRHLPRATVRPQTRDRSDPRPPRAEPAVPRTSDPSRPAPARQPLPRIRPMPTGQPLPRTEPIPAGQPLRRTGPIPAGRPLPRGRPAPAGRPRHRAWTRAPPRTPGRNRRPQAVHRPTRRGTPPRCDRPANPAPRRRRPAAPRPPVRATRSPAARPAAWPAQSRRASAHRRRTAPRHRIAQRRRIVRDAPHPSAPHRSVRRPRPSWAFARPAGPRADPCRLPSVARPPAGGRLTGSHRCIRATPREITSRRHRQRRPSARRITSATAPFADDSRGPVPRYAD